jgi:hypothetical protein
MFLGSGLRAGHDGRQKIPVLLTARKNMPSYELSRAEEALSISLFDNVSIDFVLFLILQ